MCRELAAVYKAVADRLYLVASPLMLECTAGCLTESSVVVKQSWPWQHSATLATAEKFKALLDALSQHFVLPTPLPPFVIHGHVCSLFFIGQACGWFGSFVLLSMLKWRHAMGRLDHLTRAPLQWPLGLHSNELLFIPVLQMQQEPGLQPSVAIFNELVVY